MATYTLWYRPPSISEMNSWIDSVSTPATLTPVGDLQFENGTLFANHSTESSNRLGFSQVTKLTGLQLLELFFQTELLAVSQIKARLQCTRGKSSLGCKVSCFRVQPLSSEAKE